MAISSVTGPDAQVPKLTTVSDSGQTRSPAPASPDPAMPSAPPTRNQLEQAVEQVKSAVKPVAADSLEFSIDDATGKTVVRIVDAQTGKTIRQIPSEEILAIAKNIDRMQGLLVRQEA